MKNILLLLISIFVAVDGNSQSNNDIVLTKSDTLYLKVKLIDSTYNIPDCGLSLTRIGLYFLRNVYGLYEEKIIIHFLCPNETLGRNFLLKTGIFIALC